MDDALAVVVTEHGHDALDLRASSEATTRLRSLLERLADRVVVMGDVEALRVVAEFQRDLLGRITPGGRPEVALPWDGNVASLGNDQAVVVIEWV